MTTPLRPPQPVTTPLLRLSRATLDECRRVLAESAEREKRQRAASDLWHDERCEARSRVGRRQNFHDA